MKRLLMKASSVPVGFGGMWLSLKLGTIVVETDTLSFATFFVGWMFCGVLFLASVAAATRLSMWGDE